MLFKKIAMRILRKDSAAGRMGLAAVFFLSFFLSSCRQAESKAELSPLQMSWEEVLQEARGSTVHLMMWQGDPFINRYMNEYVKPKLDSLYGIHLVLLEGQGNRIVSQVMTEKEAGIRRGGIDMGWINGETFYQLRQIEGLFGPFVEKLPNSRYIDFDNPFIAFDFQQAVEGYECPWGNVQQVIIYDSLRVPDPPRNMEALAAYVEARPGTFTLSNDFTGMTLLKAFLTELAGAPDTFYGPFREKTYLKYSGKLWDWLNHYKKYFWRRGETFPDAVAPLHQLFINGELNFSMSNNDAEVDNKILQGLFPESTRAYVPDHGSIQNSHYMGIMANGANKAGAMVVANFLISPEAQWRKADPAVWGDGTVLARKKLSREWQKKFAAIPHRKYSPSRDEIGEKAIREFDAEYMIRLYEDFRKKVIEN